MDGSTLQQIKDALLARRSRISTEKERDREIGSPEMGIQSAEIIDIAQTLEQMDRDASLAEQERRELAAIERALAKMATGNYGMCEECEEEIPAKRLVAVPSARMCAKCQAYEERQQSRMRPVRSAVA